MIRTITVRDYKSLADVTVELLPVTVLVGRSGTGKSNFVRAIRFLRDYLYFGDQEQAARGAFRDLAPLGRPKFQLGFEVLFDIAGMDGVYRYTLCVPSGAGQFEETLRLNDQILFSQTAGKWTSAPNVLHPPNPNGPMLGKLPSVSEAVIAFSALTGGIGCYEFPFGVLARQESSSNRIAGLSDEGGNYLTIMKEISSNLRDLNLRKSIVGSLATLNRTVAAVELNSLQNPSRILVTHQFNGTRMPLDLAHESEGFRRFFAHLLAIFQEPPKQLLIFEHPEDGIYPGAVALLADELKAAPELNRGQVILTTHSPWLLNHFPVDCLRVVELHHGTTRIGSVAPEQAEGVREGLITTGELLTVDPARIAEAESAQA